MNYSTLKEAYNIDTFEKKLKSKSKSDKKHKVEYNDNDIKKDDDINIENYVNNDFNDINGMNGMNGMNGINGINNNINGINGINEVNENKLANVEKNIMPYYDKDLEKYLLNAPVTATPKEDELENNKKNLIKEIAPITKDIEKFSNNVIVNTSESEIENLKIFNKNNKMYINIFLFLFIGIVIIFICEQITEIAINIGMKSCIKILKPYLDNDIKNM
jgi:hypothetical protein